MIISFFQLIRIFLLMNKNIDDVTKVFQTCIRNILISGNATDHSHQGVHVFADPSRSFWYCNQHGFHIWPISIKVINGCWSESKPCTFSFIFKKLTFGNLLEGILISFKWRILLFFVFGFLMSFFVSNIRWILNLCFVFMLMLPPRSALEGNQL